MFSIDWADPAWADATEIASPRAAWISDLFVGASDPSRAWVTYSSPGGGRLYRSDDGGGTWQDCSAGLPNLPLNAVEVDPNNADRVWVAADLGIYESLDAVQPGQSSAGLAETCSWTTCFSMQTLGWCDVGRAIGACGEIAVD